MFDNFTMPWEESNPHPGRAQTNFPKKPRVAFLWTFAPNGFVGFDIKTKNACVRFILEAFKDVDIINLDLWHETGFAWKNMRGGALGHSLYGKASADNRAYLLTMLAILRDHSIPIVMMSMGAADESSLTESVDVLGPHPCLGVTPQSAAQHKQSRAFVHKLLMDFHPRAKSAELAKQIADQARDVSLEDENAHDFEAPGGNTWEQKERTQKERDAVLKAQINLARADAMLAQHPEDPTEGMRSTKLLADEAMTKALQALFARQEHGDLGIDPAAVTAFTQSTGKPTFLEAMVESLKRQRDGESVYYLSNYRRSKLPYQEAKKAKKEAKKAKKVKKEAERVSWEYQCCGCGELLKSSGGHSKHSNKCVSIDTNTKYCTFGASGSATEHAQLKRMLKSIYAVGSSSHGRAKFVLPEHVEAVAASIGGVSKNELSAYCRGTFSAERSSPMGLRLREWLLTSPLVNQVGGGFVLAEEQQREAKEREANGPRGKKRRLS
jgi:hypothetical protein